MAKQRQFARFCALYKHKLVVCSVCSSATTSFCWQVHRASSLDLAFEFTVSEIRAPMVKPCTTVVHCPPPPCRGGGSVWALCTELRFTRGIGVDGVLQGAAGPGLPAASDPHCSREPAPAGKTLQPLCHHGPQFGAVWPRKVQVLLCFFSFYNIPVMFSWT